jgi:hypothetical protein
MGPDPELPEPDRLDRLVTVLDAAIADGGWHQPHRIVSVQPVPGEDAFEFGFRPLDQGQHPLDLLLGFVAPAEWSALGVVCFGWAAPAVGLDEHRQTSTVRASQHPDRCRVRVVTLLDRDGVEWATATLEDGTVIDEPGEGTVADALRRCLRLPTAPPPVGTAELFAAIWLADLAAAGRALSWAEAASLHPALRLLAAGGHRPQPEELIGAGRSFHRAVTWERLRSRVATGRSAAGIELDAATATWMDDGMFARWVLADVPPLPLLLGRVATVLPPQVLRRVRRALRAWNLDPPIADVAA